MNNVTNVLTTRAASRRKSHPLEQSSLDKRTQESAKRSFAGHGSASKRKKTLPALLHSVEQGNVRRFQTLLSSYSFSKRLFELRNVLTTLSSLSSEDRKRFEPILVRSLLSTSDQAELTGSCALLTELPYYDDESLELQILHGKIDHVKEHSSECINHPTNNSLLLIAATVKQFEIFHLLVKMGLEAFSVNTTDIPPMLYLIRSIHTTHGPLDQYDDLFDAIFKPDQWQNNQRLYLIAKAAQIGLLNNCLELVAYAKRKAGLEWSRVIDSIFSVHNFYLIGFKVLQFSKGQPISDLTRMQCAKGRNALHWAIALDNVDLINALLDTPLIAEKDQFDQYPLHLAGGQLSLLPTTLEVILQKAPFCVYYPDKAGKTPFHYALEKALYWKLQILGSGRFYPDDLNNDPLVTALFAAKPRWEHLHFDADIKRAGANALHFAVAFENQRLIRIILDTPGDWFHRDDLGLSPLDIAIHKDSIEMVKTIVKKLQIDPDWWDKELSVLHTAYGLGHMKIFHFLMSCNPPPKVLNQINQEGYALLHFTAANSSEMAVTQALLKSGSDPNVVAVHGLTPLFTAHPGQFALLIRHGADVNHAKNIHKKTPLHAIFHQADYEAAKLLIQNGANPLAKDVHGYTPLGLHVQCEPDREVIQQFIEAILPANESMDKAPFYLVAMSLLTNLPGMIQASNPRLTEVDLQASFEGISKRFPSLNPEAWRDLQYVLDKDHFQYKLEDADKHPPCPLSDWMLYLEKAPIEKLKYEKLKCWFGMIDDRSDCEGVPQDPQEKREFYDRVERKVCEILVELRSVDETIQREKLNALYDTARRCGGAWLFDTTEIASELNPTLTGIREQIYLIAQSLQEHIIKEFSFGNVHEFFSHLIPLKEMIPSLAHDRPDLDTYAKPIDPEETKLHFNLRYTPTQLIDTLLSELETRKPNLWISWLRSFVPKEERDDYIDPLYDFDNMKWTRQGAIELLLRSGILKSI